MFPLHSVLEVYFELSKSPKIFTDKQNQNEQCFLFCRKSLLYLLVLNFNMVLEVLNSDRGNNSCIVQVKSLKLLLYSATVETNA